MKINHLAAVLAGTAMAAALAIGAAPAASASETTYIQAIDANDALSGPVDSFLTAGYMACDLQAAGLDPQAIAQTIYDNTNETVTMEDSQYIAASALIHLC